MYNELCIMHSFRDRRIINNPESPAQNKWAYLTHAEEEMNKSKKLNSDLVLQVRNASSLVDLCYEAIRDGIISSRFRPGEKLNQLDLARELDVSQRTVRDALSRLVSENLVEQTLYKGFMVVDISVEEQEEIYELRAALEGIAMDHAVEKITDAEIERMRDLIPLAVIGEDSESLQMAREANREFHMIPVLATGKRQLIRMLDQIWDMILTYYLRDPVTNEDRNTSHEGDFAEHTRIVDALAARDAGRARMEMVNHIHSNLSDLKNRIRDLKE
jgi:DNA-binding GntR family transcriptional regulator